MTRPVRIANCSGFYGDRLAAAREMLDQGSGPIDVLTGDYLAELTMLILWKARRKDPGLGYATTFLRQMEDVLGTCLERGVKVVANAGGLNPEGLAARITELAGGSACPPGSPTSPATTWPRSSATCRPRATSSPTSTPGCRWPRRTCRW